MAGALEAMAPPQVEAEAAAMAAPSTRHRSRSAAGRSVRANRQALHAPSWSAPALSLLRRVAAAPFALRRVFPALAVSAA
jgi:hypothetical protein